MLVFFSYPYFKVPMNVPALVVAEPIVVALLESLKVPDDIDISEFDTGLLFVSNGILYVWVDPVTST